MEVLQRRLDILKEDALKAIKEKYDNDCLNNIDFRFKRLSRRYIYGQYSHKPYLREQQGFITINEEILEEDNFRSELLRTMIHEIGHLIHHMAYTWKSFRFPSENRTEYSKVNGKENFAEAFSDYILGNRYTPERDAKMELILRQTNKLHKVTPKAKPQTTRKTKGLNGRTIVIYNPQGQAEFTFKSYEEAQETLEIFTLAEIKWLVNGNRQPSYGPKSKFRRFDGYKFTIEA